VFAARPPLVTLIDGQLPAFAALEVVRGGTRLLELQSACPFRAAVELRLGGRELEDPVAGIAPTERGTLAHDVLEAFWNEVHDQATLAAMPDTVRAELVRRLTAQALAPMRAVADDVRQRLLDLEQRWLEARVLDFIALDLARTPFAVVQTEAECYVDVGGVQVRVQLDRVDRLADGSLAVIDYKTGANARPSSWMGERPESPQLPLYVRVVGQDEVSAVAFGVVRKGATAYTGIARDGANFPQLKAFDATKAPFKDYADWHALMREWQRRLDALAREHAAGDASLAPNPGKACVYCHLAGLCRSGQAFLAAEGEDDDDGG
jgi:RecB family exonuclease